MQCKKEEQFSDADDAAMESGASDADADDPLQTCCSEDEDDEDEGNESGSDNANTNKEDPDGEDDADRDSDESDLEAGRQAKSRIMARFPSCKKQDRDESEVPSRAGGSRGGRGSGRGKKSSSSQPTPKRETRIEKKKVGKGKCLMCRNADADKDSYPYVSIWSWTFHITRRLQFLVVFCWGGWAECEQRPKQANVFCE